MTHAPHLTWTDMPSSRHNPNFDVRNHRGRLEIENAIADFRNKLFTVYRDKDQEGMDELLLRVRGAREGLEVERNFR
jgi:hypothetical protein